jgi:hypothetical protein
MRTRTSIVLILALLTVGCAVSKKTCVNCTPETLWRLNIASEIKYQNDSYRQFFKDVGAAQRAGQLSADQVKSLNTVGYKWKTAIEDSNRTFKAYDVNPDASTKSKVINVVLVAEQILLELTTARTQMMVHPGGVQ